MFAVHVPTSIGVTITGASAQVTNTLKPNVRYMLTASALCWVAQGATLQTAVVSGASGTLLVLNNSPVYIWGDDGAVLSVVGTSGTLIVTACAE